METLATILHCLVIEGACVAAFIQFHSRDHLDPQFQLLGGPPLGSRDWPKANVFIGTGRYELFAVWSE